jgi:TolB protein
MLVKGGDAFPLSYGDFDNTNPRWSPDGRHIAFISNRTGNTFLWTQAVPGGAQRQIIAVNRRYLHAIGQLNIIVLDPSGRITSAHLSDPVLLTIRFSTRKRFSAVGEWPGCNHAIDRRD